MRNKIIIPYSYLHSKILLLWLFCITNLAVAQNVKTEESRLYDSAHKYLYLDQQKSISFGEKGLALSKKNHNDTLAGLIHNAIGNAYHLKGDFVKAFKQYSQALRIFEKKKTGRGLISTYVNLGYVHADQYDYPQARKNYRLGIEKALEIKDSANLSNLYNNIAVVFKDEKQIDSALFYHFKALEIRKKLGRKNRIAVSLSNIGAIYFEQKEYDKSKTYHLQALEIDSTNAPPLIYLNLSGVYMFEKDYDKALFYAKKALRVGESNIERYLLVDLYIDLYKIYSLKKQYALAIPYADGALALKDSLAREETKRIVSEAVEKYESEKKELQIQNLNKQKAIDDAELQKQSVQKIAFAVGFGFLLVFFVFLYRGYRQKQKANLEILHQKHLVEEKQKEIIDSINYAKGIQSAILAKEEEIKKYFPGSFLLYQPKDIVAGDFYFFETTSTHLFYAAADCTGHGVPGALVSVVCSNALTRCVKEFGLTDPGKILDRTRELVVETFRKSGQEVKDGMDISLISLTLRQVQGDRGDDQNNKPINNRVLDTANGVQVLWSGANNPFWYIQSGQMKEIKANKQPIGRVDEPQPFTTHTITLQKGDAFFLFTDGYADQFGGPKGKKFKYSTFQQILEENASQDMETLRSVLITKMEDWQGDLEQVDDICILGVRI